MTANSNYGRLTAAEVLRRYNDADFPDFCGVRIEDVNQVGIFGDRPLHIASVRGNMDEIAALVEAGADVNAPGDLGNTPLHEAVAQGHATAVKFLLDNGASVSATNEFGETPIDIARLKGRDDILRIIER